MLKEIEYKELVENKYNPRKRFDDAEMVELTESIKRVGLLEPLVVRQLNGKYEVVCGIRRYRALGHINNGDKIPCNIVKVDDHQAMVLSFTENFERVGFSPVEEARFFYNALEIKGDFNIKVLPSQDSPNVQQLAKDLPASAFTISKRLYLLTLPEKVLDSVEIKQEDGGLSLLAAEQISRLRRIDDDGLREKKMLKYAREYAGTKPNLEKLHDDINSELELYKESKTKDDKKLKEYEKLEKKTKKELQDQLDETITWYNSKFDDKLESDAEQINSFLKLMEEKSGELITDKTFNDLAKKQYKLEDRVKRLEINLDIIEKDKLSVCPFCGGFANYSKVKDIVKNLNDNINSLKGQQANISDVKREIEEYRENLHKKYLQWESVCELIEKENGGEENEDDGSLDS